MKIAKKRKEYKFINILFKTIYRKKSAKWKGDYLRKKHIFHHLGENVHLWGGVPSEYSGRFYTPIPEIGNHRSDMKETAIPF